MKKGDEIPVKDLLKQLDDKISHWEHWSKNTHYAELSEEDIELVRQAIEVIRSDYEY